MKRTTVLFLAVSLISLAGFSQDIDKTKLDTYFDALETNNKFMGSVAISRNGELIYTKSIGFADLERKQKADRHTKYRIGSISKTFTTVLTLKAVEENKLKLNQTLDIYFPTLPNGSKITIEQLLCHRSGIHNFTNDKSYLDWNTQFKTEQEMTEIISKAGIDFEPDEKTSYSNSNFVLLTYILERTYRKSYAKLLEEKITKPLGLSNTCFGKKIDIQNNECYSYTYADDWKIAPETDMSIPMGAGGLVSTPIDLTLFSDALFGGKLLSESSLSLMKNTRDNLGMGLAQIPFYDKTGFGHTGGIDGFSSLLVYFPDGNYSLAYTSNGIYYNGNNVAIAMLSAVYGKAFDIPDFKTYNATEEELNQYLGVYSSKEIPLKMTITKEGKKLFGQATGQSSFPLKATEKNKFTFEQAAIVMEFTPEDKTMVLKQGGFVFEFTRE